MVYNAIEVTMSKIIGTAKARYVVPEPTPSYDDEVIDWDCSFDDPPAPKASGRIEVLLRRVEIEPSLA